MQNMNETIKTSGKILAAIKIKMFFHYKTDKNAEKEKSNKISADERKNIPEFIIMSERIEFMIFDHFLRLFTLPRAGGFTILYKVNRIGR